MAWNMQGQHVPGIVDHLSIGSTAMTDSITKAKLLDELRTTRQEWETLLASADPAWMTRPATVADWSVKDVIFHCTS